MNSPQAVSYTHLDVYKRQAKIPPKIRVFSFAMLLCFLATYFAIIGYEIIKSCLLYTSIITLHTMEGEPFLIGLSKMFVFCGDKAFLDRQLIPYLRSMGGESV